MNGQMDEQPSESAASSSSLLEGSARKALEAYDIESALDRAIDALKTGDFRTRWDVAKSISEFGPIAIAPLLVILEEEDSDWELLWFIARILGNLEHPTTIAALVHLLKTADVPDVAGMAATALANLGTAAIAPLSELLNDASTRVLAVQALSQIRDPEVILPLLQTVNDASPTIRAAAIEALSHFYAPDISSVLLAALNDPAAGVRQAAVEGLGVRTDQHDKLALISSLKPRLQDVNVEVCRQTAIALSRIGVDEAATVLFEVLRSPHTALPHTALILQTEAVRALARIGSSAALGYLQQFLLQPFRLQPLPDVDSSGSPIPHPSPIPHLWVSAPDSLVIDQEIVMVLGRVEFANAKLQAAQIMLELLQSQHPLVQDRSGKQAIALSLGQLGQLQAIDPLIQFLADPESCVKFHAIAALKQLAPEIAHSRLEALSLQENLSEALKTGVTMALQEWK